jgi:hypothetical protein
MLPGLVTRQVWWFNPDMTRTVSRMLRPILLLVCLAIGGLHLSVAPIRAELPICHSDPATPQSPDRSPDDCDLCLLCVAPSGQHDWVAILPSGVGVPAPRLVGRVVARPVAARMARGGRVAEIRVRGPPTFA